MELHLAAHRRRLQAEHREPVVRDPWLVLLPVLPSRPEPPVRVARPRLAELEFRSTLTTKALLRVLERPEVTELPPKVPPHR